MSAQSLRLPTLSLVSMLVVAPAWAADAAHELLVKMARATRTLDYEGSFIYQHRQQIESMRIVHKVIDGVPRERLVSLNGVPREIVRDAREVHFYYPRDNLVIVEQRRADRQDFPNILPERVQGLNENYEIRLGKKGRVAGRPAQKVRITPRDGYRYGYRLWADNATGLLLKAELVDENENMLEQFVFAHISIGGNIPAEALVPEMGRDGMKRYRNVSTHGNDAGAGWSATRLPKGFKLSTRLTRETPQRGKSVEQLVYSDGLAAVSVFIEKYDAKDKTAVPGTGHLGAVHAYAAKVNGYQITTMGEVPAATVSLIGGSVVRQP